MHMYVSIHVHYMVSELRSYMSEISGKECETLVRAPDAQAFRKRISVGYPALNFYKGKRTIYPCFEN
jgi:hypothetical protein